MANEEHVRRLAQGVDKWNAWRKTTRSIVDLIGADLVGVDLRGANLSELHLVGADLSHADLRGANLSTALLTDATLRAAYLIDSNLREANLVNADLREAHLIGANLSNAILCDANLSYTQLHKADFTGAHLVGTSFAGVSLTHVIGLETCKHEGPSTVDHRTLEYSGPLPLVFMRGIGLPEKLIQYLPSLFGQAIQYYSCFISYSTKDQEFAERLHADLQNDGVRCWFAPHDMPIGHKILDEIDVAIRLRDKVLLILSKHSIQSDWVEDEVTKAFEEERKRAYVMLFPIRLDDAVMDTNEAWAAKLRARHIGDFRRWKDHDGYKKSYQRVLRDLKRASD